MSREIKFRVWDKDLKKMHICGENQHDSIIFSYPENEAHYYNLQNGCGSSTDGSGTYELMQYTGLKDKHGKEIYEGDIVEYNDFNSLRTGGHAEDKIIVGKVAFSCGMWMVEENNCGHDLYEGLVNDEELEIIGNIYENPELLEGTA
ncbi:YopX family protein [Lysinibacillus fusiformis]|uniref:YopX family protein n=1 Tax=Lysinibacillus fusiformis TaxID=28031 RepID=UPI003D082003